MSITNSITISASAWLWDHYGKQLVDHTARSMRKKWSEVRWSDAAQDYRKKIKTLHGTMQIMGMSEAIPLDEIFTEAYLLDKPTAFGRFDIEQLQKRTSDPDSLPPETERIGGLTLVNRNQNLFILGKPGAGKTTFLKYIALKAAEGLIDKVPIFISLKQWADANTDLISFIAARFDVCGFPQARPFVEEILKAGHAIVLFDGLDEVNKETEQRDLQTNNIKDFVDKYDQTQCLVTCRIAANDYSFERFVYVEIADFTHQQIETFVANWFRKGGEKDQETCERFLTEFARSDNRGLRDLARTPLLLTLLCLAFNETLTFPQRRVEIYEEASEALLKRWDASRRIKRDEVYRKLSLGHKENMLARIAAETFEKNQYFIPQRTLEELILSYVKNVPPHDANEITDAQVILKSIEAQHGIFVERAHKVYSFSHLTLQEYFTSKYVVTNASKGTLVNLIRTHSLDKRWHEVFQLTTSLLPDASQFITTFQTTIDDFLRGDKELWDLLNWADQKSRSTKIDRILARPIYVFLEGIYRGKGYNPMHGLNVALSLAPTDDPKFIKGLKLDHSLSRTADLYLGVDIVCGFYEQSVQYARDLQLRDLEKELKALQPLTKRAVGSSWNKFSDKICGLAKQYRDGGRRWKIARDQELRLIDFLDATAVLKDCIQLAFMSPDQKNRMLSRLYLPPAPMNNLSSTTTPLML